MRPLNLDVGEHDRNTDVKTEAAFHVEELTINELQLVEASKCGTRHASLDLPNEDAIARDVVSSPERTTVQLMVCDGAGGEANGVGAAKAVCKGFVNTDGHLRNRLTLAHQHVQQLADLKQKGTATSAAIEIQIPRSNRPTKLALNRVGDSRVTVVNNKHVLYETPDQNLESSLARHDGREKMIKSQLISVITNAFGVGKDLNVTTDEKNEASGSATNTTTLFVKDLDIGYDETFIVISCDGVHNTMDPLDIAKRLAESSDWEEEMKKILSEIEQETDDDMSCIVLRIPAREKPGVLERIKFLAGDIRSGIAQKLGL